MNSHRLLGSSLAAFSSWQSAQSFSSPLMSFHAISLLLLASDLRQRCQRKVYTRSDKVKCLPHVAITWFPTSLSTYWVRASSETLCHTQVLRSLSHWNCHCLFGFLLPHCWLKRMHRHGSHIHACTLARTYIHTQAHTHTYTYTHVSVLGSGGGGGRGTIAGR